MSIDRVRSYLAGYGLADSVLEFDVSSATVELAVRAVGTIGARIAKTIAFKAPEGCLLVVTAGDAKIDNIKFKAQFHNKARMLTHEEAFAMTGYAVGGVCPFALDPAVAVYLDVSLRRFDTVFPACGSSNSAIELAPDKLFVLSNAGAWVDVCKGWAEDVPMQAQTHPG